MKDHRYARIALFCFLIHLLGSPGCAHTTHCKPKGNRACTQVRIDIVNSDADDGWKFEHLHLKVNGKDMFARPNRLIYLKEFGADCREIGELENLPEMRLFEPNSSN